MAAIRNSVACKIRKYCVVVSVQECACVLVKFEDDNTASAQIFGWMALTEDWWVPVKDNNSESWSSPSWLRFFNVCYPHSAKRRRPPPPQRTPPTWDGTASTAETQNCAVGSVATDRAEPGELGPVGILKALIPYGHISTPK